MSQYLDSLSKKQSLTIALLSVVAAFILASAAIDTGSLWHYFLCFIAVAVAIQHFIKAINKGRVSKK